MKRWITKIRRWLLRRHTRTITLKPGTNEALYRQFSDYSGTTKVEKFDLALVEKPTEADVYEARKEER